MSGNSHFNDLSEPYFEEEPVFCVLIQEEMKEKAKLEEEKKDEEKEDPKGIPEFWLTVFKNVDLLSDMLQVLPPRQMENGSLSEPTPKTQAVLPPAG